MFYLQVSAVFFVATGIACWFFVEIDRHINQD
jgi:hypothetical protein